MTTVENALKRRRLIHMRDLLRELVVRDLKVRYKRSLFGIAWSLLVPLAQLLVLYIVFRRLLPLNIPNYTSFLFTGILPWSWFQSSLMGASGAIVENRELVHQVGFPVGVLPSVTVISQLIHFILALPILAVFLVIDQCAPSAALLMLPVVIAIQFCLTQSLAYLVATFQVIFRDTQYLLGIFLFLFFYLTPVFYDSAAIPGAYSALYQLNPLVHLLDAYRSILIRGQFPDARPLLLLALLSFVILLVGYMVFIRARDRFVEEL